ncbi:MAG: MobA/MobL family protein [Tagaea sp.]|nr:MobA/MobL family protein [Tagaea sp.]
MIRGDDDEIWQQRNGRLDESAELSHLKALLHGKAGPAVKISWTPHRSKDRPRSTVSAKELGYRALPLDGSVKFSGDVSSFHFRISSTSRRPLGKTPRAIHKGVRVALYPSKREARILKTVPGAKRHRAARVWSVPRGHAFLRTSLGMTMASEFARAAAAKNRDIDPVGAALTRAQSHQRYVERSGGYARRADELETDGDGQITMGTIGETPEARRAFWTAASAAERRCDARIQQRLICELPFWVSASDRREILRRFCGEFTSRGLGWFAAAHLPDRHGDLRNHHAHIVIATRPFGPNQTGSKNWRFAESKDRTAQGQQWLTHLRHRFAEALNAVVLESHRRTGRPIVHLYDPRRNIERGITQAPGEHLGNARSAIRRCGRAVSSPTPEPDAFEVMMSLIRSMSHDREALTHARERLAEFLVGTAPRNLDSDAHKQILVRLTRAAVAIEQCDDALERLLGDDGVQTPTLDIDADQTLDIDLGDLLAPFSHAGRLTVRAVDAIDAWIAAETLQEIAQTPPNEDQIGDRSETRQLDTIDSIRERDEINRRKRDVSDHTTAATPHLLPESTAEHELDHRPRPKDQDATTVARQERTAPAALPERTADTHTPRTGARQAHTKKSPRQKMQPIQERPNEAPSSTKLVDEFSFRHRYADDADALARADRMGRGSNRMWFSHEIDPQWARERIIEKIREASDWLPGPRDGRAVIEENEEALFVHIGGEPRIRIEYSRARGWNVSRTDAHPEGRLSFGDGPLGSRLSSDFWIGVVRTLVTHAALAPGLHAIRNEIQEEMKDAHLHFKDGYGVLGSYERPRGDTEPRIVVRADGGYIECWGFDHQLAAVFKKLIVKRRGEDLDMPLSMIVKMRAERFCQDSPQAVGMSAKEWAAYDADLANRQGSPPARPWPERVYLESDTTEARAEERQQQQARQEERMADRFQWESRFYELLDEEERKRKPGVIRTITRTIGRWFGGEEKDRKHSRVEEPARDRQQQAAPTSSVEPRPPSLQSSVPGAKPDTPTAAPPTLRRGRDDGWER